MIEKGRYSSIPKNERICQVCKTIEDEFHLLDDCILYQDIRLCLLTNINNCTNKRDVKLSSVIAAGTFDNSIAKYVFECFQKRSSQKV